MNIFNHQISLDAPIGNEDEINLYDLILNEDSPSPDINLNEDSVRKEINRSLMMLTDRESEIVRSFYGFDYYEPLSLNQIAFNYGLSHERVRQILVGSIKKLKSQHHSKNLLIEYICD